MNTVTMVCNLQYYLSDPFFERGNLSVMISFMEVCKNTRNKLGRELHKKEKEFLQWMYKRYEKELKKSKHTDEYGP